MAISRKPRQTADDDNGDGIVGTPLAQIFPEDQEAAPAKTEVDDRLEAMAKQLADLQRENSEMQRMNMQLLSNPVVRQPDFSYTTEDPNKVQLPDPALDPEGYERAVSQRIEIRERNKAAERVAKDRKEQHAKDRADALEQSFNDAYPDYSIDKAKLEFATTQVAKAAQRRGLDVERYMFVTSDRFMEDVVKEYDTLFGSPVNEGDDDLEEDYDEEPARPRRREARPARRPNSRRRNRQEDDDMVSRTAGVFGGTESGGRPNRGKDVDDGPDMIADLHAIQRKSGFY